MNVLMISGDTNILTPGSDAHARLELQRSKVDRLDVFVWPQVHTARETFSAARSRRYDVITAQDPFWRGLLAWLVAHSSRARLNVQVHADLDAQPFLRRALARFVLRRADSVRAVSEKLGAHVCSLAPRARVSVLPIYVDISRFTGLAPKPHAHKTMLWVGRFEPEKDPLRALEVFKKVRDTDIDARLVMLGSGSMELELRSAARELPVEFPGWRDPLPYLQVADIVISTSRSESWGASIVEALAAGVPVVATDVGVAREAGATIATREDFAEKVIDMLRSSARGELKLSLPNKDEWAKRWKQTFV